MQRKGVGGVAAASSRHDHKAPLGRGLPARPGVMVSRGVHGQLQRACGSGSHGAHAPRRAVAAPAVATGPKPVDKTPQIMHSSIVVPEPVKPPTPRPGPIVGPELGVLYRRFKKLQNGSDIRGVAIDGVPGEPVSLTVGAAYFIGVAFARWLRGKVPAGAPVHVAVGRDPRLSGQLVEGAVAAGLASEGADVTLVGLATTPCMFYTLVHQPGEYQGSIMITASHQPWNFNGLKFFVPGGGLEKNNITELVATATQACGEAGVMIGEPWAEQALVIAAARGLKGAVHHRDFRPLYAAQLRKLIVEGASSREPAALPLLGLKIVVDAGNGAGGFFATEVLAPLGADITGSRYLDPDGSFPNHPANPEHPSAMASGAQAVLQAGADLGVVFDTDVDRSAIVDRHGREINSNRFIALMAAIVLREFPGTTVVTDSVTSNGLADFITQLGGKHVRFKRGYKNVIGKGVQLNKQGVETHLMMETSGHGAIKENWFLDDGAFLAVKVIIELVRRRQAGGSADVGELLASLKEPLESKEFRVRVTDPDHAPVGAKVLERFHGWVTTSPPPGWQLDAINHEGWRVNIDEGDGKSGWVLLRQSLHDPLLVLNVESEVEGGAMESMRKVADFLVEHCSGLPIDMSVLRL